MTRFDLSLAPHCYPPLTSRPFAFSFCNTHKTHRRPFRPSQSLTVR